MTTGTDWQIIDNYYADFYVNPIIRETLIDQSLTVYEISRIQNEKKKILMRYLKYLNGRKKIFYSKGSLICFRKKTEQSFKIHQKFDDQKWSHHFKYAYL